MSNPEIDIKMNIVPPSIDDIKKRIAEIVEEAKAKEKELSQFSAQAIEMSEAAQIMLDRAKATGKANVEETLTSELSSVGLENALNLGAKVEKNMKAFSGLPALLDNVLKKAEAGSITLENAAEQVERYNSLLQNIDNSPLETDTGLLSYDLENAAGLDDVLALWEKLSRQADENAQASRKLEEAAKARAQSLLEEKEALDENSAGYQKQASELIKSSIRFEEVGERAASQAAKFDTFKKKLADALSNVDSNEGTKKALELFKEYEAALAQQASKTEKVAKQLEATDNDRVERLRKAEADAQKAEEQAQKRAENEAKRVAKQEELAQREKFAMSLVNQTRQELIATIQRLTEEQKKASEAGDKEAWKNYTLQITAARRQLERLRSSTNLNRIAFMQQAQTAQQLGQGFRTLVDTVTNFGKAAENGTLNLTGLTSTLMSLGYAVKAGLGPLGWAMTAVELLTSAWNIYAKEQKKVEEAEKKRKEAAAALVTEYTNAANEAERLRDAEADRSKIDALTSGYRDLNTELRNRNELLTTSLRMLNAEAAMTAKEEDFENTVAKNDILVSYYTGKITEEQRDKLLEELEVKRAAQKGDRSVAQAKREADAKIEIEANAFNYLKQAEKMKSDYEAQGEKYKYSDADMQAFLAAYTEADSDYKKKVADREYALNDRNIVRNLKFNKKTGKYEVRQDANVYGAQYALELIEEINKKYRIQDIEAAKAARDKAFEKLQGFDVADIESGDYARWKKTQDEATKIAQRAFEDAQAEWKRAKTEKDAAEEKLRLAEASAKQDAKLAEKNSQERARLQTAKKEFEAAKKAEETAARIRKEAEAEAARAAAASMKLAEEHEKLLASSEWAISKNNPNRLRDEDAKNVNTILNKLLPEAVDGKLTEKQLKLLEKKMDAADKSKTEVDDKLIKLVAKYLDVSLIKNKKLSSRVDALQRDL